MVDLRRVAIIFVIAVLYAVLVNALIEAFYLAPRYEDYCKTRIYPEKPYIAERIVERKIECPSYAEPTREELNKCADGKGFPEYLYDTNGCAIEYKGCNYCQRDFDIANQKYSLAFFIISSVFALLAIGIGLLLPVHISLNEWIAAGFMLGGLVTLFYGTVRYYEHFGRYVKPLVILVELLIVIYLAYKKLQDIKIPLTKMHMAGKPKANKRKAKVRNKSYEKINS